MNKNIESRNKEENLLDTMTTYSSFLLGVIYNIIRDRETAKDILQNTYVKAVKAVQNNRYCEEDRPKARLAKIAKNESISYLRERRIHAIHDYHPADQLSEWLTDTSCPLDIGIDYGDIQHAIAEVVAKQWETSQHIFKLFFLDGQKMEDIALILDKSSGTIRSTIYRMRHKIIPDWLKEAGYWEKDFKPRL